MALDSLTCFYTLTDIEVSTGTVLEPQKMKINTDSLWRSPANREEPVRESVCERCYEDVLYIRTGRVDNLHIQKSAGLHSEVDLATFPKA